MVATCDALTQRQNSVPGVSLSFRCTGFRFSFRELPQTEFMSFRFISARGARSSQIPRFGESTQAPVLAEQLLLVDEARSDRRLEWL